MLTITIIGGTATGRNEQGYCLYEFLTTFPTLVKSQFIPYPELESHPKFTTDILILFCPSPIELSHLTKITYSTLYLAEYADNPHPNPEFAERFQGHFLGFLVTSRHKHIPSPFPLLLLPLRFNPLPTSILSHLPTSLRPWDASFVGSATQYQGNYLQRCDWVKECRDTRSKLRLQTGLLDTPAIPLNKINFPNPTALRHPLLGPSFYRALMCLSKIALTPAGNDRWTYRHYEAIQCGCAIVSTDIRDIELLIPLPIERMIIVTDHDRVIPSIEQALKTIHPHTDWISQNRAEMSRYLLRNQYTATRPLPAHRFLAQLESHHRT
jgi:hypothetical protein